MINIDEFELRNQAINDMYPDVYSSIEYDEWSAKEFGNTDIDTYSTTMNLYDKGYRREADVLEKILIELDLCAINANIEEDILYDIDQKISELKERFIKMKEKNNMTVDTTVIKIKSACVKCSLAGNDKNVIFATGFDHSSCYERLGCAHGWYPQAQPDNYNCTEGFICTDGKFVDRMTAMKIAKEANQLKPEYVKENYPMLYSYMVYYRVV